MCVCVCTVISEHILVCIHLSNAYHGHTVQILMCYNNTVSYYQHYVYILIIRDMYMYVHTLYCYMYVYCVIRHGDMPGGLGSSVGPCA